jgi:hypothetical protein
MGVSMAISAITHTTTAIIDAKQSHNQQADSKKSHYYSSKSSNGYVRLSPYPSRSTMMMPL